MTIKNLIVYLIKDIWVSSESKTGKNRILDLVAKKTMSSIWMCCDHYLQLQVHASALTYYTIFALIPILAFSFAIGRGFGMDEYLISFLNQSFSQTKNPDIWNSIYVMIDSYLSHARGGVFVGIGIIFLLWSVYNVFTQIEKSFNEIWGVKKMRPILRRFFDYFSLILLIPFLIIIYSGLNIYISSLLVSPDSNFILTPSLNFLLKLLPWILCMTMCTFIYLYIPNTKVHVLNAIIAGTLAGITVMLFKDLYLWSMKWVTSYNAVYGSLAAIPIMMVFIRFTWIILLFGGEISFGVQHYKKLELSERNINISAIDQISLTIYLLKEVVDRFEKGEALDIEQVITKMHVPAQLANQTLEFLQECDIIYASKDDSLQDDVRYRPKIAIDKLTLAFLLDKMLMHVSQQKDPMFFEKWKIFSKYSDNTNYIVINDVKYAKDFVLSSIEKLKQEIGNILIRDIK